MQLFHKNEEILRWLVRIIVTCLTIQLWISLPLWVSSMRTFPLAPMLKGFWLPVAIEMVLFILVQVSLLVLLIRPLNKTMVTILLISITLLVICDESRLQPWVYLFGLMLLPLIFFTRKSDGGSLLLLYRLILSGTYFWSGVQKMNPYFGTEMFPWLMNFTGVGVFFEQFPQISLIAAVLEALAAIGLWVKRTRSVAVFVILVMHIFILLSLGPFGHNWNHVVWPWNITFAIMTFILFSHSKMHQTTLPWAWKSLIGLFIGLLPLLGLWNLWDHFLSGGFYSAMAPEGIFYYHEKDRVRIPRTAHQFQFYVPGKREEFILLDHWALDDLHVPVYPEERTHVKVARELCECIRYKKHAGLKMNIKSRFVSGQQIKEFSCTELLGGGTTKTSTKSSDLASSQ